MSHKFDCIVNNDKQDLDIDYVTDSGTFGFYFSNHFDVVSVHFNTHRVWRGNPMVFFKFVRAMVNFSFRLGLQKRMLYSEVDEYITTSPSTTIMSGGQNDSKA